MAYGCLYKSMTANHVNEIRPGDVTLTMMRYTKPVKLFEDLQEEDIEVVNRYPGIYYMEGATVFRTQAVVAKELPDEEYIWLKALTDELSRSDAGSIVTGINELPFDSWERRAADAVAQVAISANKDTYDRMKKEDPLMCEALKELMRPEFEEELNKVLSENTRKVTLNVTQKVRKDELEKEKKNNMAIIVSLHKQNIPIDILKTAYGEDMVNEALGLNKTES